MGALQFSIALHTSGTTPKPTSANLRRMVETFGQEQGLGSPADLTVEQGPPRLAAGTFMWNGDFASGMCRMDETSHLQRIPAKAHIREENWRPASELFAASHFEQIQIEFGELEHQRI
jgi:hypothetical protein